MDRLKIFVLTFISLLILFTGIAIFAYQPLQRSVVLLILQTTSPDRPRELSLLIDKEKFDEQSGTGIYKNPNNAGELFLIGTISAITKSYVTLKLNQSSATFVYSAKTRVWTVRDSVESSGQQMVKDLQWKAGQKIILVVDRNRPYEVKNIQIK